jgi:hypothetical protein
VRPAPARPVTQPEGKPTPVRESMETPEDSTGPAVPPDVEAVAIEVEGASWVVHVRGRSLFGRTTPVLLLSFERTDGPDRVELEGWVVGRALAQVPVATLQDVLGRASPPRKAGRRPFFDEGVRRERRDG